MSLQVKRLVEENQQFAGTGGVSEGNKQLGFIPAFMDSETGEVEVSKFKDGRTAPCHLIDGLPQTWIEERDDKGRAISIKNTVISGFVYLGQFLTRSEAAALI